MPIKIIWEFDGFAHKISIRALHPTVEIIIKMEFSPVIIYTYACRVVYFSRDKKIPIFYQSEKNLIPFV